MAVTAQSIITRVRTQLLDPDGVRWTDAELLKWLSDGQRTLVANAAGISSIVAVMSLVAGTKQIIPTGGYMLLTILRNIQADGVTPGRACRIVSRELMDSQNPNWHNSTASPTVQNYVYDPQQPGDFYVYPPNDGTGKIQLMYAVMPDEMSSLSTTLVVQDLYQTALYDYVMYRAHQKDSDYAAGMSVAMTYWQSFAAYLNAGETSLLSNNPNLALSPPDPTVRGAAK